MYEISKHNHVYKKANITMRVKKLEKKSLEFVKKQKKKGTSFTKGNINFMLLV